MSIESLRERLRKAGDRMHHARAKEIAAKNEQRQLAQLMRALQTQVDDAEHSVERNRTR